MEGKKRLFVSARDESPKMFENPFLDFFSRTPFYTVPILFVPISSFFAYRSLVTFQVEWPVVLGLFLGGYAFWTLMEYFIHRAVFHYEPTSDIGKKFIHIAHGVHHDFPNDALRLVMPPVINLSLGLFFYIVFHILFPTAGSASGFFSGFTCGYLAYDLLHYSSHYYNFRWKWFQELKRSHLLHHYRSPNSGYGLSTVFWDRVFRTTHPPEAKVRLPEKK